MTDTTAKPSSSSTNPHSEALYKTKSTGNDILFFSSDDWGWKTSKYHVSTRLAKQGKVLFISSIGFRAPTASSQDMGRIWRKLKSFFKGTTKVHPNLHVLTPLVIPFQNFPGKNFFNQLLVKAQVAFAMKKLGMHNPLMFVFSQNWYPYIRSIKRSKCIYYVVDDHSSFKGLNAQQFKEWDRQMCQHADGILCTSRSLYEQKKQYNSKTINMPHGVDHDNFYRTWDDSVTPNPEMMAMPGPKMLFFGHISYEWVDVELLSQCAQLKPDWSWVLVGRNSMADDEFKNFDNIYYLGEQEFTDLPNFCKAADVGIIPFIDSGLTRNCNPLKLPEYVTAGLGVVSTPIPSVIELYSEDAEVARSPEDFVAACERMMARTPADRRIRAEKMSVHSWDNRVARILQHIEADF